MANALSTSISDRVVPASSVTLAERIDEGDFVELSIWNDGKVFEKYTYRLQQRLAEEQTAFQHVLVASTASFGRALFIDDDLQSAECDEHLYHESFVQPAMVLHDEPQRVLILGGGEGATLREVLRHDTVTDATMVDVDGRLVQLCRTHLPEWSAGAFDDPRTRLIVGDAEEFVLGTDETFDVVIMDITEIDCSSTGRFHTQAFYRALEARLRPGGLLAVQAGELDVTEFFGHCCVRKTMATVFEHVRSSTQNIPSFCAQWSWLLASRRPIPDLQPAEVAARIAARVRSPLRFYDGAAHLRLFTLTRDLHELIETQGIVVDDIETFRDALAQYIGGAH